MWTDKFVAELKKMPELEDVATDQQTGARAVSLTIDRVTASRLGVAPTTIDNTLYDAYGQREINTLYTQVNQYHVILETAAGMAAQPCQPRMLYIQSNASSGATGAGASTSFSSSASQSAGSNALTTSVKYTPSAGVLTTPARAVTASASTAGSSAAAGTTSGTTPNTGVSSAGTRAIPLGAFTHMATTTEALAITHQGQFPAVTVSFNLAPDASLGTAITKIDDLAKKLNFPATVQADFQGTAASFRNSLSNEALLIIAALVTVYIVLGVLYESFIHPITILSTLPSAGVGALLALMIFHQDLSVVAIIGIILLIGIVKKNGIMIVDFALESEREHGKNSTDAIYEASLLRFRPIMMTTMAALLGGIPLAVGTGLGSELRRPLGICMVGGLLLSQVLTLYTTPVIYIFFDNLGSGSPGAAPRTRPPGTSRRGTRRSRHESVVSIHSPAGGHHAAHHRRGHCRCHRIHRAAGVAAAAGRFPNHQRAGQPARRQRGDDGRLRRHAAGASVRAHRRHYRDDFIQSAREHQHHAAIRSEPQHRWRRPRRGVGHQWRAHLPAHQPAGKSQSIAR